MGIVRVSGRGQFVCHGSVVMAGWRCPEADASSRWLIVRTDLFLPTPTMIAVQIRMCAARAIRWRRLIGQTDPFGTPAKPPFPLQSRANVRPQYAPAEEEASAPAGPPLWRQRARQEAPPQQEYEEPEPEYQRAPCILCTGPRARQPQRQNRTITSHNKTRTSSRLIRHAMTTRFMTRSNPSSRKMRAIRPIRTILTPINAAMSKSQSRASAAVGW